MGKKLRKHRGPDGSSNTPAITPASKCKLRLLKLERVRDYLLMEEEFVSNQERLKPQVQALCIPGLFMFVECVVDPPLPPVLGP